MGTKLGTRWMAAGLAAVAAAGAAYGQPANDLCDAAAPLAMGTPRSGTTAGATRDIEVECFTDDRDVWYVVQTPAVGPYRLSLTSASADVSLSAVTNCGFPYAVTACATGLNPTVTFFSFSEGEQVLVRVGTVGGQSFTVRADAEPAPANDECSGATVLPMNAVLETTNYGATTSFALTDQSMCGSISEGFGGGADLFYRFTAPSDDFYLFQTCGNTEIDTVLSVHSGCPASPANAIACNDDGEMDTCVQGATYASYLDGVHLTAGQTVILRVASVIQPGGFVPQGRFTLQASSGLQVTPPANDDCANAADVSAGSIMVGNTAHATESMRSSCAGDDPWDVWYRFTSTASVPTLYTFKLDEPAFTASATLSAYESCGGNEVACQMFNPFTNPVMELYVAVDPGQPILVRVAGTNGLRDEFVFRVIEGPPAAENLSCQDAEPVLVGQTVAVDTTAAMSNSGPDCGGGEDAYGLWYTFQAGAAGYYRVETANLSLAGSVNTTLSFVRGACGSPTAFCTQTGDMFSEDPAAAAGSIRLNAGERLSFRAAYAASQRGTFDVRVTGPLAAAPAVTNDTCATARVVSLPYASNVNVTLATPDTIPGPSCDLPLPTLGGTWYAFTPQSTGFIRAVLTTNDTRRTAHATVFSGTCSNLTRISGCPDFNGVVGPTAVVAGTTYRVLITLSPTLEDQSMEVANPILYGTEVAVALELITPPVNDTCAGAYGVASAPADLVVDNVVAGPDAVEPSCFGAPGQVNAGVWYKILPATSGELSVYGQCPDFAYSPGGVLLEGDCGNFTEVACDGPINGWLITNEFEFTASLVAGRTYYLLVGHYNTGRGGLTNLHLEYTGELTSPSCLADFNGDGFIDFFDYDDYVLCFESGACPDGRTADSNGDGFVDFFDYDDFVAAFEAGC